MNVADAMSATGSRLRAGRCAAPRKARRPSARQPRPRIGRGWSRRRTSAVSVRVDTSSSVPAPKNPSTFAIMPAADAATTRTAARKARGGDDGEHAGPPGPRRAGFEHAGQERARRTAGQAAERPRDGGERHRRRDADARREWTPRRVHVHALGADRANPPRSEARDEGAAVGERAGGTHDAPDAKENGALPEEDASQRRRPGTRPPSVFRSLARAARRQA